MDEWRTITLNKLGQIVTGKTPSTSDPSSFGGSIPFITPSDMDGRRWIKVTARYLTERGAHRIKGSMIPAHAILVSCIGSDMGKAAIAAVDSVTNQQINSIIVETSDLPLFVYYNLSARKSELRFIAAGSAQPILNKTSFGRLPIKLPPLNEQRAIVNILGPLDDKFELNNQMNETLESISQILFNSWFVNFEPVRAKLENKDSGLPDYLDTLFPDSFEESELGEIPAGWEIASIEDLSEKVAMGPFGSSIKVSTFVESGIPIISGQHLNHTILEDNDYNFITPEHAERLRNSNVFRGDIIFTHAGNIGQVSYIPETSRYERYVISQRQFYMRCDLTKISPFFMVYYFKSPEGQHMLLANTSSSGVPSIAQPVSYLKTIKLRVPPKPLVDEFDNIVRALHLRISNNREQSNTLADIRDSLLPKLISAKIRVDPKRILGDDAK